LVINPTGRFRNFNFRIATWIKLSGRQALYPSRPPAGRPIDRPACVDKGADKIGITFRDTHVQTY